MVDDPTSCPSDHTSGRFTRDPTKLRRLPLRHVSGDRTPFTIDMITSVEFGLNVDMLKNNLSGT